jgi:hypothetical protein
VLPLEVPQRERQEPGAQPELARLSQALWQQLKAEAQLADREVADE